MGEYKFDYKHRCRRYPSDHLNLGQLETKIERKLAIHDQAIIGIIIAIRELMPPPEPKKRPISFITSKEK